MPRTILFVSKPVAPPWNDSSKNLVRNLALAGERFRYRVLTTPAAADALASPSLIPEAVYRATGTFSPALLQNARPFARLLRGDDTSIAHFFFAPNPRSAAAIRVALALRPRLAVQTVCSEPRSFERAAASLFGERTVVLSRSTRERLVAAGVEPCSLVEIPPGIPIPCAGRPASPEARAAARRRLGLPASSPVVVYPGDYQFSSAAWTFARAIPILSDLDATFLFACRVKQEASREVEAKIRADLGAAGALPRVRMVGEVPSMPELLSACDLCVLPAESLYAKMDLPMVLLEAMALGLPLVVADAPPLSELVLGPDPPGEAVPPRDPAALAAAVKRILLDPGRASRLGEIARERAVARYDIQKVARRHEELYEELLDRKGR